MSVNCTVSPGVVIWERDVVSVSFATIGVTVIFVSEANVQHTLVGVKLVWPLHPLNAT